MSENVVVFDENILDNYNIKPVKLPSEPEFVGRSTRYTGILDSFGRHNSSPRRQMFYSQISQVVTLVKPDYKRISTGAEQEFGKYTFKIKAPKDLTIRRIYTLYPNVRLGEGMETPYMVILYEEHGTNGRMGVIKIPNVQLLHKTFGFRYKIVLKYFQEGTFLPEGTVIADSENIQDNGFYHYSKELNTTMISTMGTIEDGLILYPSGREKLKYREYSRRAATCGKTYFPLPIYGTPENPKVFPDIGEEVREDGLLMVLREYHPVTAAVTMTPRALRTIDHVYDRKIYAKPGCRVVDIRVTYSDMGKGQQIPKGLETQFRKYWNQHTSFHNDIFNNYQKQRYEVGGNRTVKRTPAYHNLLVKAFANRADLGRTDPTRGVQKTRHSQFLDEWSVEFVLEKETMPNLGNKLSDHHGGKGVICGMPEEQAYDAYGREIDIAQDAISIINRMNLGKPYEIYINHVNVMLPKLVDHLIKKNQMSVTDAVEVIKNYYKRISPENYEALVSSAYAKSGMSQEDHLRQVIAEGVYLRLREETQVHYDKAVKDIVEAYGFKGESVNLPNLVGGRFWTVAKVISGDVSWMLLEKDAREASAVASAKTQHHGIPTKITQSEKYSSPIRENSVKILGEAEDRWISALAKYGFTAELLDISNNPVTAREVFRRILTSPTPTCIRGSIINRKKYPIGGSRSKLLVMDMLSCQGIGLAVDGVEL